MHKNQRDKIVGNVAEIESHLEAGKVDNVRTGAEKLVSALDQDGFGGIEEEIMSNLRWRLDCVVRNVLISGDEFGDVRESLKNSQRKIHPISEIARLYGYTPLEINSESEKLNIDWWELGVPNLYESLGRFDDYDSESEGAMRNERKNFWSIPIYVKTLKGSDDKDLYQFSARKMITEEERYGGTQQLQMEMEHLGKEEDENGRYVCDFDFSYQGEKNGKEVWFCSHRQVNELYRGQKIAAQMIYFMEENLRRRAEQSGKKQVLEFPAGDALVLLTMKGYGYEPATQEDKKRFDEIISGDKNLVMASAPNNEQYKDVSSHPQYYIFKKDVYFLDDGVTPNPEIWDIKNYGKDIHYMRSSYRVTLKKEF